MSLPQRDAIFSYADYLAWEEGRWELIDGTPVAMSPAPSRQHHEILGILFHRMFQFFKDTGCHVYVAPFDVRLPAKAGAADGHISTVVQPDISVICDRGKLDDRGCLGAPDLIVEILSPASAAHDLKVKRSLYEKHGVREYWLAHPGDRLLMAYVLDENLQYGKAAIFSGEDTVRSAVFSEFAFVTSDIFAPQNTCP